MPVIDGKRVLSSSVQNQSTLNARGGINRKSERESSGTVQTGSTGMGSSLATPSTTAPAITSSSLAPSTSMVVAPATPATQTSGMMAEFTDQTDAFTENLKTQRQAAEAPKTNALDSYINQLTQAQGLTGLTNDAYAVEGGVNDITPELNDINDRIRREQLSMRRRSEEIEKNLGGGSKAGIAAEIANVERESFAKQADLSVIQMAVQGRYDSAKEIADRAVSAKLEKQTNDLAILKFNYEENKEVFNKAEQREFESLAADRERKLLADKENATAIYDLGIQASLDGAPTSVVESMLKAKTREEALALGGNYIGALDRQVKYASIENSRLGAAKTRLEIQDIQDKQAAIAKAVANGDVVLDEKQQETAYKLGKDFEAESKDFKTRVDSLNTVIASAQDPSAAGDLALIFSYMKMLDPTSVVREQEFANAQNAAGIPERVRAQYNNALRGERLTENTRTDFVDRATDIYNSSLDQQMELESRYKDKAVNLFGLPENAADLVVQDIRAQGAVSDVVFGVQLNNASDTQLQELIQLGLVKPQ